MSRWDKLFYPDDRRWRNWGIENELHRLFLLGWVEMFEDTTLDSWQVRTCNVRTLLGELADVAQAAQRNDRLTAHLGPLLAEAIDTAAIDPVASDRCPFLAAQLKNHNPHEIPRNCAVALKHLGDYRGLLASHLRNLVEAGDATKKTELVASALALGTELASGSHSLPHLQEASRVLRDTSREPFLDRYDHLLQVCTQANKTFTCTFSVKWPPLNPLGGPFTEIAVRKGAPPGQHHGPAKAFYKQIGPNDVLVEVVVAAPDCHEARHLAEARLRTVLATMALFRPQTDISLKSEQSLVVATGGEASLVSPDTTRLRHIRDLSAIQALLQATTETCQRLRPADASCLQASMEYHHFAVSAGADEVRLVNLWTALECLAAGDGPPFDRLLEWVPLSLGLRATRKHLRGLARYIREHWRHGTQAELLPLFPNSTERNLSDSDLYDVLAEAEGFERIEKLFATVKQPLIRFRMFQLHKRIRSPKDVVAVAQKHALHVEWQLRRIYRARNSIAHEAVSPPIVRHLVQHLHTYYVLTIRGLIDDMQAFQYERLADCFQHRKVIWRQFVEATPDAAALRRWTLQPTAYYVT